MMDNYSSKRGVAALPMVLIVAAIIFEVAIVGAFVIYYSQQGGPSYKWQTEARAAAAPSSPDGVRPHHLTCWS